MTDWIAAAAELDSLGECYVIVTVIGVRGSAPRAGGTKMVIGKHRAYCSIGGGHLEYKAIEIAREMLSAEIADQRVEHFPLGPRVGQCCGGTVNLLFEYIPVSQINIMLFGAGHVAQALVHVLGQLPYRIKWVESREQYLPDHTPDKVIPLLSDTPADEVYTMPANSYYIVMTHSHSLDFDIVESVLRRGDAQYIGLIGSETKSRRFRQRLEMRGLPSEQIDKLHCPIGLRGIPGKRPAEVAVSIAGELIAHEHGRQPALPKQPGVSWKELRSLLEIDAR